MDFPYKRNSRAKSSPAKKLKIKPTGPTTSKARLKLNEEVVKSRDSGNRMPGFKPCFCHVPACVTFVKFTQTVCLSVK